jgi:hypothetical protein
LQVPRFSAALPPLPVPKMKGLPDNILGVLKSAQSETLINQSLDFGLGDLNRHGVRLLYHYRP